MTSICAVHLFGPNTETAEFWTYQTDCGSSLLHRQRHHLSSLCWQEEEEKGWTLLFRSSSHRAHRLSWWKSLWTNQAACKVHKYIIYNPMNWLPFLSFSSLFTLQFLTQCIKTTWTHMETTKGCKAPQTTFIFQFPKLLNFYEKQTEFLSFLFLDDLLQLRHISRPYILWYICIAESCNDVQTFNW